MIQQNDMARLDMVFLGASCFDLHCLWQVESLRVHFLWPYVKSELRRELCAFWIKEIGCKRDHYLFLIRSSTLRMMLLHTLRTRLPLALVRLVWSMV